MANYNTCKQCGAPLGGDDIAIYRKLVHRGAQEFLCIDCLAAYFQCPRAEIEKRIRWYRESGSARCFAKRPQILCFSLKMPVSAPTFCPQL